MVGFSTSSLLAQLLRRESGRTLQRVGSRMDTTQALFLPYLIPEKPTLHQKLTIVVKTKKKIKNCCGCTSTNFNMAVHFLISTWAITSGNGGDRPREGLP